MEHNYPEFSQELKYLFANSPIRFRQKFYSEDFSFICTRPHASLLFKVIRANDLEFMKLLLDLGVSPNAHYGIMLSVAASVSTEMVDMLLSYGADPVLTEYICKFHY